MEDQNPQIPAPSNFMNSSETPLQNLYPLPSDPKKKRPILIVIATILILVVITSLATFFLGASKNNSPKISTQITPTPTPTSTPTANPTANWKTYTGNNLSFKYPQDFEITSNQDNSNITVGSSATASDQMHVSLNITKNTQNITLEKYLQNTYGQPTHPGGNPTITVDGIFKSFQITSIPLQNSYSYTGDFGGSQSKVFFLFIFR